MISVFTACLLACAASFDQQVEIRAQQPARVEVVEKHGTTPTAMGLQGYSVVLVVGDMQTPTSSDSVPSAARKALTDMQAFLPFKRYQLLDAAWMVCCGMYRSPINGRVRGPEDREYTYSIDTISTENGKLMVRFVLKDGDALSQVTSSARSGQSSPLSASVRAEYSRQLYEAQKERDEAEIQARRVKERHNVGLATEADLESANVRYRLARTRTEELERTLERRPSSASSSGSGSSNTRVNLLDSTFAIAVGETVVIGTSRLKGDQALIAMLTAAGKPGASR